MGGFLDNGYSRSASQITISRFTNLRVEFPDCFITVCLTVSVSLVCRSVPREVVLTSAAVTFLQWFIVQGWMV